MKSLRILSIVISTLFIIISMVGCTSSNELLVDKNLEAAVSDTLDLLLGETITTNHLANLVTLSAENSNISNLTGLEYCINLAGANLSNNKIRDISPIIFLNNLTSLNLQNNRITQIPAACTFSSLISLNLSGNQIGDISPLDNIPNLANLSMAGNRISDISSLASLFNLTRLDLSGNQISDIFPLIENDGLSEGDEINLEGNNLDLSESSEDMQNIRTLQDRGVQVNY